MLLFNFQNCEHFQKDGSYKKCKDCDYTECPKYEKLDHSKKNFDPVNRPAHYADGNIEVIDFIEDKKLGFCLGNAIKYIARAGKKDKDKEVEDILKARWYLNRYLKQLGYEEV